MAREHNIRLFVVTTLQIASLISGSRKLEMNYAEQVLKFHINFKWSKTVEASCKISLLFTMEISQPIKVVSLSIS